MTERKPLPSFDQVRAAANGRWPEILAGLGIDAGTLRRKHGRCPGCGGKDRFRFDDKDGRGTWFCGGGGADAAGDGFQLLEHVHGWASLEALRRVAGYLGMSDATPLSESERKALREAAGKRQRTEREREQAEIATTVKQARAIWDKASPPPSDHPYLIAKGVPAIGLRYRMEHGTPELLVPLCDAAGDLRNLERILPPDRKPNKLALGKGVAGLFHWLGERLEAPATLVLAEGYATAASVHVATGLPVMACRSANNLLTVAKALQKRYRGARIALAADADAAGETAAKTLAAALPVLVIRPTFNPAEVESESAAGRTCKDFNDLHRLHGVDAVAACCNEALSAAPTATNTSAPTTAQKPVKRAANSASGDLFQLTDSGLHYMGEEMPLFVCDWIEGYALTRDREGKGWLLCLRFRDRDGVIRETDLPTGDLLGDGVEPVKKLSDNGLRVGGFKAAKHLMTYLRNLNPDTRVRTVYALGWHDFGNPNQHPDKRPRAFLWPDGYISGPHSEQMRLHHSVKQLNSAACAGTLEEWQREIAALCVDNSRLAFAVSCGFAAPMMTLLERPTVGFNIFGDTSTGKSTSAHLAASVFGRPKDPERGDYLQAWRSTDNGMEAIARAYSGYLLAIDELKQIAPQIVQDAVYMLGNERAKARATVTGDARALSTWRLLYLSTGEITVRQHMAEVNKKPDPGVSVRLIELPADPGKGLGVFDTLHDYAHGKALSDQLKAMCSRYYGTPGRAFVERLCNEWPKVAAKVRDGITRFVREHVPADASPEVSRAADAFAVVAVAGELASRWGVTGWSSANDDSQGESHKAASACFRAWLNYRGGLGNAGDMEAVRQFATFLSRYREGRFQRLERAKSTDLGTVMDTHAPRTLDIAGYVEHDNTRGQDVFYFEAAGFAEACKGFSPKQVAKLLKQRGHLITSEAKGLQYGKRGLPGKPTDKPTRTYAVLASAMELADPDPDTAQSEAA